MRFKITQQAERDLKDIYRYTELTFGRRQAEKYLRELDTVFELIGDNPRIGRKYDGNTHRFLHGKHIILYRVKTDHVLIGRIFHGAQAKG